LLDRLLEPLHQHPAARQPGQLVVQRVRGRERLGALATVDVGQRTGELDGATPAIAAHEPATEHPAKATVALAHAVLELMHDRAPVDVRSNVGAQTRKIVVVHTREPHVAAVVDLLVEQPEQLPPA
jgi:hypothetical protein